MKLPQNSHLGKDYSDFFNYVLEQKNTPNNDLIEQMITLITTDNEISLADEFDQDAHTLDNFFAQKENTPPHYQGGNQAAFQTAFKEFISNTKNDFATNPLRNKFTNSEAFWHNIFKRLINSTTPMTLMAYP